MATRDVPYKLFYTHEYFPLVCIEVFPSKMIRRYPSPSTYAKFPSPTPYRVVAFA